MPKLLPAIAAALLTLSPALAAETVEIPQRQAGMWQLKTEIDEGKGPVKQSLTMCIDAAMEKQTAEASKTEHQSSCSRYAVTRDGDKTVIEAVCAYAVDEVSSRTEMSGDFKTAFDVKITSTTLTRVPNRPDPMTRQRVITQKGERLGDSCGDLKPGEAKGEDGRPILVQ